ncbi:hypothetical protein COI_2125 [Mannheimia haemolytica serotype A2 str. OVINE]|nr:hypothetical protein COI_2125 [Mannheimia haemolytica serotype A2 str. OVINE]
MSSKANYPVRLKALWTEYLTSCLRVAQVFNTGRKSKLPQPKNNGF